MYSQKLIFFITYVQAQYARVLHYSRLEWHARDKDSSLLGSFMSLENQVLRIWSGEH
jgi:hypothetical protein